MYQCMLMFNMTVHLFSLDSGNYCFVFRIFIRQYILLKLQLNSFFLLDQYIEQNIWIISVRKFCIILRCTNYHSSVSKVTNLSNFNTQLWWASKNQKEKVQCLCVYQGIVILDGFHISKAHIKYCTYEYTEFLK